MRRSPGRLVEPLATWGEEIPHLIRFTTQSAVNTTDSKTSWSLLSSQRGEVSDFLFQSNQHGIRATFFSGDSEEVKRCLFLVFFFNSLSREDWHYNRDSVLADSNQVVKFYVRAFCLYKQKQKDKRREIKRPTRPVFRASVPSSWAHTRFRMNNSPKYLRQKLPTGADPWA